MRHVVGWSAPVLALAGLFAVQLVTIAVGPLAALAFVALVAALVGLAGEVHARLHPAFRPAAHRVAFTFWVLPALITLTIGLGVIVWMPEGAIVARSIPAVGAILAGLALFGQDRELERSDDASDSGTWTKQLLSLLTYFTAFVLFTVIYQTKERSFVSAPIVALAAGLLSVVLLRGTGAPRRRMLMYALLTALAAGEVTWALNYWVVRELVGGAVLLLLFYVVVGLNEVILRSELTTRLLVEYVSVGVVGFLLILSTGPWRP